MICITNPLDAMVWALQKACGLPKQKWSAMAGVLDSSRSAIFSPTSSMSVEDVTAFDARRPWRHRWCRWCATRRSPHPAARPRQMGWTTQARIDEIVKRTRDGGAPRSSTCSRPARRSMRRPLAIRDGGELSARQEARAALRRYLNGEYA